MADGIDLAPEEWQTMPLIVYPPGYAPAAVALLAELHGRMGYFPSVLRLRPVPYSNPPQYEVAEIINCKLLGNELGTPLMAWRSSYCSDNTGV